jgi:hypothetical protein
MKTNQEADQFLAQTALAFEEQQLVRLTFSKPSPSAEGLLNLYARPVVLEKGVVLSCTYRYATRDETKNYGMAEAMQVFRALLGEQFLNADLMTTLGDWTIRYSRKRKPQLIKKAATHQKPLLSAHNHEKKRLIKLEGNVYLQAMGITTASGELSAAGQRKYRQIDILMRRSMTSPRTVSARVGGCQPRYRRVLGLR